MGVCQFNAHQPVLWWIFLLALIMNGISSISSNFMHIGLTLELDDVKAAESIRRAGVEGRVLSRGRWEDWPGCPTSDAFH
jgi:hypothetical protein